MHLTPRETERLLLYDDAAKSADGAGGEAKSTKPKAAKSGKKSGSGKKNK